MGKEINLRRRTKQFALRILEVADLAPEGLKSQVMVRQLVRCGTSVGANYRAACRARSVADFISKMKTVEEEADEAMYWLELLAESGVLARDEIMVLYQEADEIVAITGSSIQTARQATQDRSSDGR